MERPITEAFSKSILAIIVTCSLTLNILAASTKATSPTPPKKKVIVFVCEHGVAKSIVAAAHFNRLAQKRKLPYIAVARGTEPQDSLMASVAAGLQSDKLAAPEKPASKLTQADCDAAKRTVFFCPIPATYRARTSMQRWQNVPPVSEGYPAARDSIVANVQRLLKELTTESPLHKGKP